MKLSPFMRFTYLAAFTVSASFLYSQSSLETWSIIEAGHNEIDFVNPPLTGILPGGYGYSNVGAPLSVNASGEFGPMTFSAQASASASYLGLRTYASGELTDTYFEPYFPEEGDPQGVENFFNAYSYASFTDTLSYGGTAVNYNSRYLLNLSGSIFGEEAFNIVTIQHANDPVQRWSFFNPGNYDVQLVSDAYVHGAFAQEIRVTLQSYFQVYTGYHEDGSIIMGTADFDNTLVLGGVELRDENGVLLPDGTITSASGTNYGIIAIPEPSTGLLAFASSVLLMAGWRRRLS